METSTVVRIGLAALSLVLFGSNPSWSQNAPVLTGSSTASSTSAVSSLTLTAPAGLFPGNLLLANLSQSYGSGPTLVSLSSVANKAPFSTSGTAPSNGGFDGQSYAFASNLVGTSLTWNGVTYPLCGVNTLCAVHAATITLPAGNYTTLNMLASNYDPGQSMTLTVTYTDNSTTSLTQSFSNWGSSTTYAGETLLLSTAYRITPTGGTQNAANGWNLYGYTFALNSAKTVKSITLPSAGVVVFGMSLSVSNAGANAPAGWTQLTESWNGAVSQSVYYRIATSADVAGSTPYAFTFPSAGVAAGSLMAFGGTATSNPTISTASQLNAASTSSTAPAVTYTVAQTWVGLYSIANGTTSGSDFSSPLPGNSTKVVDTGTGSGASGVLLGGFYYGFQASGCASSCASSTWVATSSAGTSAASIGTSILLNGALPSASALWHLDQSSWSGTSGEVVDSSGNGYSGVAQHGASTNGVTPAISGVSGTCFYGAFNGSTQYVQLPSTLPHVGGNSTITAWVYPTAATGSPSPQANKYGARIFWDDYNRDGFAVSYSDPGSQRVSFYGRSPSTVVANSQASLTLNQWYFIAAAVSSSGSTYTLTLSIYGSNGTLIDQQSTSGSGTWSAGTGAYATIGGNADASVEGTYFHFPGSIDEVAIYDAALTNAQVAGLVLATHPCASYAPDHYAVSAAASAVNCQATPVTIAAHTSSHAAFATTDTITITTSTGHGDWTLASGNGAFAAGASNSGSATYAYAQADGGNAVFSLRDTYAETVTINVTDGSATAKTGAALASEDSPISFAASGFRITNGSNVATVINTQKSGVASTQSLALQAVRTDTNTGACTSVFASGSTVNVSVAYQCNNPLSCVAGQTLAVTNNGATTNVASNPNASLTSYTTVPLKFTTANGEAPISLNYTDAGQISLAAKYTIPLGSGAASGSIMTGSSQFVVQPYTLALSNIKLTATGAANPGTGSASGTVFAAAGQAFTATVTATNYQGTATPNFGQETSAATVALTANLVLPTVGHDPVVSGAFGAYTSGAATGTAFSWPEVGIITLTPGVASSPGYLGSGAVTGTASGDVGRFIPNAFLTTVNTPVFGTACSAGAFGYVGQPFNYTVAPVITTTALAVGGTTASNYTASLMRLTNASLTGRTYTPTPSSPALNLSGLPASTSDPVIADLGTGQVSLTFNSGTGISFTRGSAIAPFSANIALSINVIDLDGAAAANPANPVTIGSSSGIAFSTGASQLYGKLALGSALGSELLDLPMPLTTQYYKNATQGFMVNGSDTCTAAPALSFSSNATSGLSCVRDSGKPGVSGQGCPAAASNPYAATASSGSFNLILAAPGAGNAGAFTVTANGPTWLSPSSPSALATFGIYPGSAARVYQREVY